MDSQFLPTSPKKDTTLTHKRHIERGVFVKAIYMITNLFDESEPLKVAMRTEAVLFLDHTRGVHPADKLKAMLRLSGDIGIVSEVNTKILLEALEGIESTQRKAQDTLGITDMFTDSSLGSVSSPETSEVGMSNTPIDIEKSEVAVLENSEKKEIVISSPKATVPKQVQPERHIVSSVAALDIGARRKKILEVVRSKGQATIHEFIHSIQGCSSKTIQRELTSLVLSGTLKKTGERRWSKYSLR